MSVVNIFREFYGFGRYLADKWPRYHLQELKIHDLGLDFVSFLAKTEDNRSRSRNNPRHLAVYRRYSLFLSMFLAADTILANPVRSLG
jgi:hypothetical protein